MQNKPICGSEVVDKSVPLLKAQYLSEGEPTAGTVKVAGIAIAVFMLIGLVGIVLLSVGLPSVEAAEEAQANVLANRTIARFTSNDVPFAEEFEREGPVLIQEVRVTFSAEATAGNFYIGYDSSGGAVYDSVPWSPDMAGEPGTTWTPENGATLDKDSILTLDFANATTLTIGVEVVYISF